MAQDRTSVDSLMEATRGRAKFSGHGRALGAAGIRVEGRTGSGEFLNKVGAMAIIDTPDDGFGTISIGAAWDNIIVQEGGFFARLFKKVRKVGVDVDLGCLYELQNGQRGAIQAFGDMYGDFDGEPFIQLSGDERTGDAEGHDEKILVNGAKWPEIKRILVYVYIYDGVPDWSLIKPQIQIDVPGEDELTVEPESHRTELDICAIAGLENVRNGIKLTNYTEYFPGHPSMDRAFGFGIQWEDGEKA